MKNLKAKLLRRYKARDLGPIGCYLGIRILRDRPNRSLCMTMDSYVDRLVDEYHLTDAPKADNPLPKTALNLTKREDKADDNLTNQYQSLVAKLLYPTSIIRCDLSWHVNFMARFANNPTEEQLSLLKHMLRYYKGTAALDIKYQGDYKDANMDNPTHTIGLKAYSDSAHSDNDERKSSSGYVITMAGGVASYKSYRQRLVTLSSTESEYIAMTYAAKEIHWVQRLFKRYSGVYFYAMLVASIGIIIHAVGYFIRNFDVSNSPGIEITMACGGGMLMITGQSVVLWSRLHLISPGKRDMWLLWMILADCIIVQGGATTLFAGSNSPHPKIWLKIYAKCEIFQVTWFVFQECL